MNRAEIDYRKEQLMLRMVYIDRYSVDELVFDHGDKGIIEQALYELVEEGRVLKQWCRYREHYRYTTI